MKTEGKPVDSVIQYQLHKDNNGVQSGNKIQFVKLNVTNEYTITQEDYDEYKDFLNNLEVGDVVTKKELEIVPNKINMDTLYVPYRDSLTPNGRGYFIVIGLGHTDLHDFVDLIIVANETFYSNSIDRNYVYFSNPK